MAKNILDRKYSPTENIELNEYQKQRIEKAKTSIKGEYLTNEQADEFAVLALENCSPRCLTAKPL